MVHPRRLIYWPYICTVFGLLTSGVRFEVKTIGNNLLELHAMGACELLAATHDPDPSRDEQAPHTRGRAGQEAWKLRVFFLFCVLFRCAALLSTCGLLRQI